MNRGYTVQGARAGFSRPEQVLRRAEELQNVGQSQEALQAIHEVLVNKKLRTWSKQMEGIVIKFIDLCIQDRNGRVAKEGLVQFRNLCQQVNINSLEEVIMYYIRMAEQKAKEAQESAQAALQEIEDFEQDASPEDLMLSYVSSDNQRDRTDRELVMPWFRLLWETYRNCLDILKNNAKLEKIYKNVALKAFQFCQQNQRTNEFKRLCDILRIHLQQLNKSYLHLTQRERPNRTDLSNSDTLTTYLEIRFEQLKVACSLELWQEAFRSVTDIEGLLSLEKGPKKAVRKQIQIDYFSRLTEIFSISSQQHLYRGFAWLSLYQRSIQFTKNLPPSDMQSLAAACVLSALSVPPHDKSNKDYQTPDQIKDQKIRLGKMANILLIQVDAKQDPRDLISRPKLMEELSSMGVLKKVDSEVIDLYKLLEFEYDPLYMCQRVDQILKVLQDKTQPMSSNFPVKQIKMDLYAADIRRNAALVMFKQLSKGYSSMRMSRIESNIPYMNLAEIEWLLVEAVKLGYLEVQLNHQTHGIQFDQQHIEQDMVRSFMQVLSQGLNLSVKQIKKEDKEVGRKQKVIVSCKKILGIQPAAPSNAPHNGHVDDKLDANQVSQIAKILEVEHTQYLTRKEKNDKLRFNEEKAEREAQKRRQLMQQQKIQQEAQNKINNEQKIHQKILQDQATQDGVSRDAAIEKKPQRKYDIVLMGAQQQDEAKEKERIEVDKKLMRIYKSIDYFERAKREQEIPVIDQLYAEFYMSLKQLEDVRNQEIAQQNRQQWEANMKLKNQVQVLFKDKQEFKSTIMKRREAEFEKIRQEKEKRLQEMREQAHSQRVLKRKEKFVKECKSKLDDRYEQEVERAKQEQEARKQEEKNKEDLERQEKFNRQSEIQKKREEEIENRKKQDLDNWSRAEARGPRESQRENKQTYQPSKQTRVGTSDAPSQQRPRQKYSISIVNQDKGQTPATQSQDQPSGSQQAVSGTQQAVSGNQQAVSGNQQAVSGNQQATAKPVPYQIPSKKTSTVDPAQNTQPKQTPAQITQPKPDPIQPKQVQQIPTLNTQQQQLSQQPQQSQKPSEQAQPAKKGGYVPPHLRKK